MGPLPSDFMSKGGEGGIYDKTPFDEEEGLGRREEH